MNVDKSVEVGRYSIPLLLNVTLEAHGQAAKFLNLQHYIPFYYNSSGFLLSNSNAAVLVIKEKTGNEAFTEFWITFGDFISLMDGCFIAGLSALILERIRNKKTVTGRK